MIVGGWLLLSVADMEELIEILMDRGVTEFGRSK